MASRGSGVETLKERRVEDMASKEAAAKFNSAAAFVESGVQEVYEDACSICLETFTEEEPLTLTTCNHDYHLQCILEWAKRGQECPMCWQPLSLKDPESQELLAACFQEQAFHASSVYTPPFMRSPFEEFEFQPKVRFNRSEPPPPLPKVMEDLARREDARAASPTESGQSMSLVSGSTVSGPLPSKKKIPRDAEFQDLRRRIPRVSPPDPTPSVPEAAADSTPQYITVEEGIRLNRKVKELEAKVEELEVVIRSQVSKMDQLELTVRRMVDELQGGFQQDVVDARKEAKGTADVGDSKEEQEGPPPFPKPEVKDYQKRKNSATFSPQPPAKMQKLTPQETKRLRKENRCFRCQQRGHIAKDCK